MLRSNHLLGWTAVCLFGLGFLAASAAERVESSDLKAESQAALEELNPLVGSWRGAAQPVRNSTRGAWTEKGEWVWEVKKDSVALLLDVEKGKMLSSGKLTFDPDAEQYELDAEFADKSSRHYTGGLDGKKLILDSTADSSEFVHRITITMLNDKRTLVLLEKRPAVSRRFTRVVEVGYTREGTSLAVEGAGEPECIVSGGKGTSTIVYKGKTYYFCCTGCREAFMDDPEGIIAEAAERAAKKKAKAEAEKKKQRS